jgi:hypothetical protein
MHKLSKLSKIQAAVHASIDQTSESYQLNGIGRCLYHHRPRMLSTLTFLAPATWASYCARMGDNLGAGTDSPPRSSSAYGLGWL